jgi:carbon monoxide dehydrogenase subunit G
MAKLEVASTVAVPAAPEKAWELLCDTKRYAEWSAGTDEVTRTDGPATPGSTYDEVNPVLGPWKARTHWTVTEFEPPRRQVHLGQGLPLTSEFEIVLELAPTGSGACELTITLRGKPGAGPLGAVFATFMKGKVETDGRKSAENFAALAGRELAA